MQYMAWGFSVKNINLLLRNISDFFQSVIKFNKLPPIFGVKLWLSSLVFVYKTWGAAVGKGTSTVCTYLMTLLCTARVMRKSLVF